MRGKVIAVLLGVFLTVGCTDMTGEPSGSGGDTTRKTPTGPAWSVRESKVSDYLLDVHYANSLWVAVGESGAVTTSLDGLTWASRTVIRAAFCAMSIMPTPYG